jgi:hypothetical protein
MRPASPPEKYPPFSLQIISHYSNRLQAYIYILYIFPCKTGPLFFLLVEKDICDTDTDTWSKKERKGRVLYFSIMSFLSPLLLPPFPNNVIIPALCPTLGHDSSSLRAPE